MSKIGVPDSIKSRALIDAASYERIYQESIQTPELFWAKQARAFLTWDREWHTVSNSNFEKGEISWFLGAKLNVSVNCLDRHLDLRAEKTAIIWEGNEPGETRSLTYSQLHQEVCRAASVLRGLGVQRGDRVAIYLPMIPEAAIALLACARIGAVHSVVFAGFSAESLATRINDSNCKLLITANQGLRGSKSIPLKETVDEALLNTPSIERVLVVKRTATTVSMKDGRDLFWDEAPASGSSDPESMDSEDPLFILYTSGSTGKPKGVLHTQAGYLLQAATTHRYVFNLGEDDIHFCSADIGWITGHSYVVYGPLCNGATTLMFESIPNYPDAGRFWDVIERHKATIFYTAPTAIRALLREGDSYVTRYNRSSLRVLGTVGEPIGHEAWRWFYEVVGESRCPIVDTWWQTETGGIMISPLPGATETKPGSATKPLFGVAPCIVDEEGRELSGASRGLLCISQPWPGMLRTIYGNHERFLNGYCRPFPGKYFTGDGCERDADGYYWITGRVDDVLNVAGHRLGSAEIESALARSGVVAEAAVVGFAHDIKGQGIAAFCVLQPDIRDQFKAAEEVRVSVRKILSAIASPDKIFFVAALPKTRSGKIMRRILRKILEGEAESLGDISTLADPAVVAEIIERCEGQSSNHF